MDRKEIKQLVFSYFKQADTKHTKSNFIFITRVMNDFDEKSVKFTFKAKKTAN